MLGRVQGDQVDSFVLSQKIDVGPACSVDSRVIRDKADPKPLNQVQRVVQQNLDAWSDVEGYSAYGLFCSVTLGAGARGGQECGKQRKQRRLSGVPVAGSFRASPA
jgi:hypothetical protein